MRANGRGGLKLYSLRAYDRRPRITYTLVVQQLLSIFERGHVRIVLGCQRRTVEGNIISTIADKITDIAVVCALRVF